MANYFASGYSPPKGVDSKEKVKQIQATLGVKQDGIWGAKHKLPGMYKARGS